MKNNILIFALCIFSSQTLFAQEAGRSQNESPYFHITTEGVQSDDFPLLSTKANVNITGPIADVTITQTYKNDGKIPIEAIYVFPASTRAAVYSMTMRVGGRVIKAKIQEKNQARQTYEKAKREGKRASLLEQFRPNVFQMNVGNILPDDIIEVELKYNEFLIPESKVYSFVYPTVVGPRFVDPEHKGQNSSFTKTPYTKEKIEPSYDFDLVVQLNAGMPLKSTDSPSHNIIVNSLDAETTNIKLDPKDKKRGNKDFILNYSLANDKISKGTFLYNNGDEKFFLTMIEPPKKIANDEIPPREYIFVVDVSGSMHGFPIDISKKLMKDLICNLQPNDKFNVLLFASSSKVLANKSISATGANLTRAYEFIDNPQGGGGTRLLPALERALALPSDSEINSRSIVVITDGYISVEREAFELIANNLNKSNLFAFGIGSSVNRHLIEGMAHAGQGAAFIITEQKFAISEAERFRNYIETPILTNIEISYENFDAYDVTPKSIPDLLAERPLYIFGKYHGNGKGKITVKGHQGNRKYEETIKIKPKMESASNYPIRYLWAREKIRWMDDLNSLSQTAEDVKTVTDLGLKYNLLTKYTSFVAVDENPVLADGSGTKTVKQVLPLPEGVSNHAVGFEMKIDGVVSFDTKEKQRKLFVHINGNANQKFKTALQKVLTQSVAFTKEEKAFLNSNTLSIKFDSTTGKWLITDSKNRLTKVFIEQFTELLKDISKGQNNSFTIQINMLWV